MTGKKNEVAKAEQGNDLVMPDYLQNYSGPTGAESIDAEDVTIPRIKLAQSLTPEVKAGEIEEGDLFLNVTGEVLAKVGEPLKVIPVIYGKEYILWRDRKDNNGGIMARAKPVWTANGVRYKWDKPNQEFETKLGGTQKVKYVTKEYIDQDGLNQWGSQVPGDEDSGIAARTSHNFVVALPDHGNIVVALSLAQPSQMKKAKDFNYMLKMGNAPMFARVFTVETVDETSDSGQYKNYKFKPAGFVQDKAVFESLKEIHDTFKESGFTVDQSDEDQGADPAEEGDGKF